MRSSACLPILALILSLLALNYDLHAQPSELQQDEYKKVLTEALDANQVDTASTLIQQNRYKVGGVVAELLRDYVNNSLAEDLEKSRQAISTAERIARIYSELFQKDYFLKKVELYSNWTSEQLRIKATADSLRKASAEDFNQHQLEAALEKIQAALEIYVRLGDQEGKARCLNSTGEIYYRLTDYPKAESHLKNALAINREFNDLRNIIANLGNLAAVYKAMYKYQLALDLFEEALTKGEELGDDLTIAKQWINIAGVYQKIEEPQKALNYYQKTLQFAERQQNDELKVLTFLDLVTLYALRTEYNKAIE